MLIEKINLSKMYKKKIKFYFKEILQSIYVNCFVQRYNICNNKSNFITNFIILL